MTQFARDAGRSCWRQWLTPLLRQHRHGSRVGESRGRRAFRWMRARRHAFRYAMWPGQKQGFSHTTPRRASPGGKPPAKPVAAQKVSRPPPGLRLGLGQEARTRRCAPGEFDGGSRWPTHQLAQGIPTPATARRWQSYGNADGWTVFKDFSPASPTPHSGSFLAIMRGRFGHDRRQTRQL